jgi:hypothetical protein
MGEKFDDACKRIRKTLKQLSLDVLELKGAALAAQPVKEVDRGEMIANVMLTYRHVEDAGMRLGKAIQAFDGGVSVYDKTEA